MKRLFYLRKSDRQAVLALLLVIVSAVTVMYFAGDNDSTPFVVNNEEASESFQSLEASEKLKNFEKLEQNTYYKVEEQERELFTFDPNTADSTQLLRLGLRPWQVQNIYKFRAKGGVYRKPSDFAHLYGLTVKDYKALEPYIRISPEFQPAASLYEEEISERPVYTEKLNPGEHIELNLSDTTELKKVPGIGSAYAKAIVNYRDRLGGYADTSQLLEISGFPESALRFFVIEYPAHRKLNINKLTLSQLRSHPYINFYQAKDITDYRRLHGNITSLNELSLLKNFTQKDIERLEPYVEY